MPRDDSCSLLLPEKKPYRDGRITFFDFRTYLFNRQWHVSVKRHEYLSAIQKAATFISSFSRSLLEAEVRLFRVFLKLVNSTLLRVHLGSCLRLHGHIHRV